MPFGLQPLDNSPLLTLFLQKEGLFPRIAIFFLSFFHFQLELLDSGRHFSVDLNRSVPIGIGNPVEGLKVSFDSLLKSVKVLLFILIGPGNAGEVEGQVFFFVEPLVFDSKFDRFFLLRKSGRLREEGK